LTTEASQPRGFAALQNKAFRGYFVVGMMSMMGDNVEHVISYWVIFDKFHSTWLAGYAVVSHWLPFLFFSVYAGGLADRFDCRKLILISQGIWMSVSLAWALLFITDTIQMWHAVVLLTLHGMAGVINQPARQMIIYDIVGRDRLQSAIRLNATSIQLGLLGGPVVGAAFMLLFGPVYGLLPNILVYLPMTVWLLRVPYTGHRSEGAVTRRAARLSIREAVRTLAEVRDNRVIVSMVVLGGLTSFFVGNGYSANMPEFAESLLGAGNDGGFLYSMLLEANAAGAILGSVLLEFSGLLHSKARTAIIAAMLWCFAMLGFAMAPTYWVAFVALFIAGALNLTFTSMGQTLVQLEAPPEKRGRIIGLYAATASGLRFGSGLTIGFLGAQIGIHWSLGISSLVLLAVVLVLFAVVTRAPRPMPTPA